MFGLRICRSVMLSYGLALALLVAGLGWYTCFHVFIFSVLLGRCVHIYVLKVWMFIY
jgi:hypothetical protein